MTNTTGVATNSVGNVIKGGVLFSGTIVRWIVNGFTNVGIPLKETQITALLVLIDLILIFVVLKYVAKPALKILIVLALVWFLIGFFI